MRVENVSFFTGKMYTFKDDETEEEHHGMLKSFIDDVNLRFSNVLHFFLMGYYIYFKGINYNTVTITEV